MDNRRYSKAEQKVVFDTSAIENHPQTKGLTAKRHSVAPPKILSPLHMTTPTFFKGESSNPYININVKTKLSLESSHEELNQYR